MRRLVKFGGPALLVCLAILTAALSGQGPREAAAAPIEETAATALLVSEACPVYVIQVYQDYTLYAAHICNPGFAGFTTITSVPGSQLGTCGMNPDCVPLAGEAAARSHHFAGSVARDGLPTLGDPAAVPAPGDGVQLIDTQLVDLAFDTPVPTAPRRVRLFLSKVARQSHGRDVALVAVGHEVRRDPAVSVPVLVAPRDVEVLDDHCCTIRLGDVNYHVLLHRDTPSLSKK